MKTTSGEYATLNLGYSPHIERLKFQVIASVPRGDIGVDPTVNPPRFQADMTARYSPSDKMLPPSSSHRR